MDREAVHGCAPRGGCVRHGPGAVGGDGARAPSTERAVALRAVAGAASGSLHSAQRTAGSASHGGRALRRSDCPACSPHRFAPASSTCAAGMDSPRNSIFLRLAIAVMEWVRHAAVGGRAAGGRTMKRRGARETLSFGAARSRPGRQGSAGHSRAGAATVGGTPRYRKRPGDALDYLVGYSLSPVLWRKLPGRRSAGRVQSVALLLICEGEAEIEAFAPRACWTVTGTATATDGATLASGGTSGCGGTSGSGAPFRAELCRLDGAAIDVRRSDCPAPSPHRFAPASSTCAAGMDSPCNSIFLGLRMAVMESVRHAAVGGCAAGGRTMKGRGAWETLSFGAAWPRAGRPVPAGHSRAGAWPHAKALGESVPDPSDRTERRELASCSPGRGMGRLRRWGFGSRCNRKQSGISSTANVAGGVVWTDGRAAAMCKPRSLTIEPHPAIQTGPAETEAPQRRLQRHQEKLADE